MQYSVSRMQYLVALHKTTSQLGRASLQACPQHTTLETLLVYMS